MMLIVLPISECPLHPHPRVLNSGAVMNSDPHVEHTHSPQLRHVSLLKSNPASSVAGLTGAVLQRSHLRYARRELICSSRTAWTCSLVSIGTNESTPKNRVPVVFRQCCGHVVYCQSSPGGFQPATTQDTQMASPQPGQTVAFRWSQETHFCVRPSMIGLVYPSADHAAGEGRQTQTPPQRGNSAGTTSVV